MVLSIQLSRDYWRPGSEKGRVQSEKKPLYISFAKWIRSHRLLKDTTPLQRGIIRHLILILDLSQSMSEKDLRPTRYLLTLRYAQEFAREFFEQNPISQLGVLGLRDGLALRVSDMSGNPTEHLTAIQALKTQDPKGLPSLQNGLEMARGALL
jgi:transcription initiation factor TFIIH subunit 2